MSRTEKDLAAGYVETGKSDAGDKVKRDPERTPARIGERLFHPTYKSSYCCFSWIISVPKHSEEIYTMIKAGERGQKSHFHG